METYELIIYIALGTLLCLLGNRVKKAAFFVIWFLIGYNLITYLMPMIEGWFPVIVGSDPWHIAIPIAGGLFLSLIGFSIEKLCVGGICFALTIIIAIRYFGTDPSILAISAVIGIVAAGLAVLLIEPATILATSIAGSYLLTVAIFELVPTLSHDTYYFPILAGIAALSAVVQFLTNRHSK